MNTIQVDLVIVYNDMVINSKLQLEKPISKALAIPVVDSLRTFSCHGSDIRDIPSLFTILLYLNVSQVLH